MTPACGLPHSGKCPVGVLLSYMACCFFMGRVAGGRLNTGNDPNKRGWLDLQHSCDCHIDCVSRATL